MWRIIGFQNLAKARDVFHIQCMCEKVHQHSILTGITERVRILAGFKFQRIGDEARELKLHQILNMLKHVHMR